MSSKLDSKVTSTIPDTLEQKAALLPRQNNHNSPRRNFLKIFSLGLAGGAGSVLSGSQAWAQVWRKIGTTSSGGGLKWRKLTPTTINTICDSQIACGEYQSLTLRSDGLVFSCGYNVSGILGDNTTTNRSSYVQSIGISNAIAIAAGYSHIVALRSDGILFSCGKNSQGQLGDGTTIDRSTFVQRV